jgi:SAM-dependent methyltransferase
MNVISPPSPTVLRSLLHVGCGVADPRKLPPAFFVPGEWREARLDIDPGVHPDIVASITDMAMVESASFDAVWSAHNLEHLFAHEVPLALAEFRRVLRPGGFALITLPDLQRAAELIAQDRLAEPAYISPAGPISPIDMLFGHRGAIAAGNLFMAHRTGFTPRTLEAALVTARFDSVRVVRDEHYALWATAHVAA